LNGAIVAIREALESTVKDVRVIAACQFSSELDPIGFTELADDDGVYLKRINLSDLILFLNLFGLHSDQRVPLTADARHVLCQQ